MNRRLLALIVSVTLVAGCQPIAMSAVPVGRLLLQPGETLPVLLQGRVMLGGFTVKTTAAELIAQAAVTLVDADGNALAAGLTDNDGAFTLYKSTTGFVPVDGATYILDVYKHAPTAGRNDNFLALRTVVQRQAPGWKSITGDKVVVNPTTTGLALLQAETGGLAQSSLIGTVAGVNFDEVTAPGPLTNDQVAAKITALSGQLAAGVDPVGDRVFTWKGNYTITDKHSAALLANVETISGNLYVRDGDVPNLALKNLREVTGTLDVTAIKVDSVELPALSRLGGLTVDGPVQKLVLPDLQRTVNVTLSNTKLADLKGLSGLRTVSGKLQIDKNGGLSDLTGLDQLTKVTALVITDNAVMTSLNGIGKLASIDTVDAANGVKPTFQLLRNAKVGKLDGLKSLTTIGGDVQIEQNPALTEAGLPGLTTLKGSLHLVRNDVLAALNFTSLGTIGGTLAISDHLALTSLDGLETVTRLDTLTIKGNAILGSVTALGKVTTIPNALDVQNNPKLPTCQAEAVKAQLGTVPATVTIAGNDDAGVCP